MESDHLFELNYAITLYNNEQVKFRAVSLLLTIIGMHADGEELLGPFPKRNLPLFTGVFDHRSLAATTDFNPH